MPKIDRRWIDVDHGQTRGRKTGCMERQDTLGDTFGVYEHTEPLIPRDEWRDRAEAMQFAENLVLYTNNQRNEGSCVGNAAAKAYEYLWNLRYNVTRAKQFSAMSLYKQIGRSASSGAIISDSLVALRDVRILPLDTPANRKEHGNHVFPATGFRTRWPSGWKATAAKFRVSEWFDVDTFDGMASCLLRGVPVVYGRSRHAIVGIRLVWDSSGRRWLVKYKNSWGNWGDNGYGYDSESYLRRARAAYGAYAPVVIHHE